MSEANAWERNLGEALAALQLADVRQAPRISAFDMVHVAVSVDGLEGVGMLHPNSGGGLLNFCVFESSELGRDGLVEVFERQMGSIDALPAAIEEWRSFRSGPAERFVTAGQKAHAKWLRALRPRLTVFASGRGPEFRWRSLSKSSRREAPVPGCVEHHIIGPEHRRLTLVDEPK